MNKVLIVDDDRQIVEMLSIVLSEEGFEVIPAYDGEHALQAVRDTMPDLVLSDVMMPRLSGLEMCSRMKADPAVSAIPVILMTALQGSINADCAACVIHKPFDLSLISRSIHKALRRGGGFGGRARRAALGF